VIRILCIETSLDYCSVSIIEDGKVIDSENINIKKSHSEFILILIKDLLKRIKISLNQLSAIAVSEGPGSYTGLRIGVSTAKGLCFSLDLPLLSVNSLDLMIYDVKKKNLVESGSLLCPMIDARRMEVYTKIVKDDLIIIKDTHAKILSNNSFNSLLKFNKINFFGNGSTKFKKIIKSNNALFIEKIIPEAINFDQIVHDKYLEGKFEDLINFEPNYLKEYYFKK
tara:strand:- start:1017 stop:1691 length:675 start_codon:yes stop_codon:yes gene_type:complete